MTKSIRLGQLTILVMFMVQVVPGVARSQVTLSPVLGYQIPSGDTVLHVGDRLTYTSAGSSAIGLDAVFLRLPLDIRLIASYLNIGNVAEKPNRQLDLGGHHWGLGFQKRLPVGMGGIELSAGYLYMSESLVFRYDESSSIEFNRGDSGFLGGLRFAAPYSEAIELTVLAKIEVTSSFSATSSTPSGEPIDLSRPGTTYVFAIGVNWNLGPR